MTTQTSPPDPTGEPTAADYAGLTDQDVEHPRAAGPDTDQPDGSTANREAAGYRRRLRETESQRDNLTAQVQRLQRAEVERIAGKRLAVAADVFTIGGAELAALLDADTGDVSPDAVAGVVAQLISDRPGLERVAPRRFVDLGQGVREQIPTEELSWSDVFKKK